MLSVEIPWASRVWALPFLGVLAPSERNAAKRGRRHKKITEWAWQLLLVLRSWYPQREIVRVADRAYASLKLLSRCRSLSRPVTFVTRLRLDADLYEPAPPRRRGQTGRPRIKGERLPNLSEVAEDPSTAWKPTTIANWYGTGTAWSKSLPIRLCGTRQACWRYPCAGFWSVILKESSKPRHCCVPALRVIQRRSSVGL